MVSSTRDCFAGVSCSGTGGLPSCEYTKHEENLLKPDRFQGRRPRRGSNAQPPDSKSVTLSIELRGRAKNVENTFKWKYFSGSQILPESYQQKCLTVQAKQHVSPRLLPASQLSFLHFEKAMNALPARLTLKITLCYTTKNPIQIEGKSDVIKRRRHNLCTTEKGVGLYIGD